MDTTNAPAVKLPEPHDILRDSLAPLGFKVSLDLDYIWGSLRDRVARRVKRAPTRGEMRAEVTAWIARIEQKHKECNS